MLWLISLPSYLCQVSLGTAFGGWGDRTLPSRRGLQGWSLETRQQPLREYYPVSYQEGLGLRVLAGFPRAPGLAQGQAPWVLLG
jgi:hypothetical protein